MEAVLDIRVNVPSADVRFFTELATKMGWGVEMKKNALRKYIESRPKNVKLSDKDIIAEVCSVRYRK